MSDYDGFYHYLPVTDADMQFGFYVTGGGRGVIHPHEPYPPRRHPGIYQFSWRSGRELPEFQLILLTEGHGQFDSEATGLVEFEENTLLVLFPGVWHRYRPRPSCGWRERWISIHGEFTHRLQEQRLLRPDQPNLPLEDPSVTIAVFDRLLERLHDSPTRHSPRLCVDALELLAIAVEQTGESQSSQAAESSCSELVNDKLVCQALDIIWTHSDRPLSVDQLAARLPTTRRTLERRFNAALGHTVLDEINHCRLSRAQRLLVDTNLPVKAIAFLAGFGDPERMRRLMVKQEGCSPSEYRVRSRAGP